MSPDVFPTDDLIQRNDDLDLTDSHDRDSTKPPNVQTTHELQTPSFPTPSRSQTCTRVRVDA